ncbi:MAG: hypothetical protein ACOVQA_14985 [Thermoflexibacteraceae bacterium]
MKKTLVLLGCALFSLAACEKENVNNPCGGNTSNYAEPPDNIIRPLQESNVWFKIIDSKGNYIKYPENELKLRNEQLQPVPFMMDDPEIGIKNFAFVVKGKDLFAHPAFRSNVPVTQIFYLTRKDKVDTIRLETKVKGLCTKDSVSYLRCYQNNKLTTEIATTKMHGSFFLNY